ncbi:MAG: hypothetical protein ABI306_02665, partial [Caulobacteraceae bacterium]
MAAISWASGTPGDWKTAADWRGGIEPGAADDVTIDAAGTYAVTISVPEAAHSLTVNDAGSTIVDDAVLSLGSTLTLTAGTFQLNAGGVIKGGSLSATGGVFQWNGGTLNGVTYLGALDLSAAHSLLNVGAQGLTTNMIDLTGNGSELAFQNTQTFKNNVFIDIGSRTGASIVELDTTGAGATLTLAPGTQIIQTGRHAAIHSMGSASGDTIVNAGLIDAQFGGGQFTIDPNVFTNTNLIEVENGDTLFLQPRRFTNISGATLTGGYYNIGAGSTLQLSDNLTIAALDAVVFLGGVGAALQSLDTISGQEITLESTLATIAAHGALNLGTQGWSSTLAMTNTGSLSLSGGAFMAASLTNSGFLSGNGTIAAPLINSGVIDNASLSLAGPAMFDVGSRLNHTTLSVANATVAGLRATGANLNDVGMIDQTGSMTLDARRGDAGLSIAKGATYEIDGDVGIAGLGNRSFSAVVNDAGILIKSAGAGVGVVTARITDTGLVEVASGTLDVRLAVGGTGAMR